MNVRVLKKHLTLRAKCFFAALTAQTPSRKSKRGGFPDYELLPNLSRYVAYSQRPVPIANVADKITSIASFMASPKK